MGQLGETMVNLKMPSPEQKKQPLSSSPVSYIQQGLHESAPAVLSDPTYASMIYKAIIELNEECGSTEESISAYIYANYEHLPRKCYLSHHLSELCDKGFVVFNSSKRYLIPGLSHNPICEKGKFKRNWMSRLIDKENSLEGRLTEEENSFGNEEFKAMNGRNMKQARLDLDADEGDELLQFDGNGIDDERGFITCKTQVVGGYFQRNQGNKAFEINRESEETFNTPQAALAQDSLYNGYGLGFGFSELEKHYIKSFEEQVMFHEQYNTIITNLCLPVEVHSHDNGCKGSTEPQQYSLDNERKESNEPQQLPTEQINYKKLLDDSHAETKVDMVLPEQDCSVAESLITPNKGESHDAVKAKEKSVMNSVGRSVDCEMSRQLPQQTKERRCFTSHQKRSEEQATEMFIDSLESPQSPKHHEQENEQQALTLRCQETKILDRKESRWPSWVKSLLQTGFFGDCRAHPDANNNKCKGYCLDCVNGALCSSCLTFHKDHRVIMVRRTLYEDAVNVSSIKKHLDITGIETHVSNCTSVVLSLKRSVPSRRRKGITGACLVCQRHLPDQFKFCSLGCKNEHELAVCGPSDID